MLKINHARPFDPAAVKIAMGLAKVKLEKYRDVSLLQAKEVISYLLRGLNELTRVLRDTSETKTRNG
jgi:hypothetical protein